HRLMVRTQQVYSVIGVIAKPRVPILSLHDALPICGRLHRRLRSSECSTGAASRSRENDCRPWYEVTAVVLYCRFQIHNKLTVDRVMKSTRLNSSHEWISYAVFCLTQETKQAPISTK